jgi:FdhD protein
VTCCTESDCRTDTRELIGEEPLLIRINDKPYSVVMRTPGDEVFHAAGFCLGEGLVDAPDDFDLLGHCSDLDPNVIEIRLTPQRSREIPDLLERKGFVSQTSCGICGKELIKDLHQIVSPVKSKFQVGIDQLFQCIEQLPKFQRYYRQTRASHAAMVFNRNLEMIAFAEDVGRHNALDKAIGKALLDRTLPRAAILILSSRISYELVQKAARAHVPIMVGMSRPTALAAEIGRDLNMTIACTGRGAELILVCGAKRVTANVD